MFPAGGDWVVISTVQRQFEEGQLRALLQAHDIPTQVSGETLRTTHGLSISGLGSVEILVRRSDIEAARALIFQAERGELSVPDVDPNETSSVVATPLVIACWTRMLPAV